jgi:hypothetical protein
MLEISDHVSGRWSYEYSYCINREINSQLLYQFIIVYSNMLDQQGNKWITGHAELSLL